MLVETLFDIRVYLIDKGIIASGDQIKGINYARKRVSIHHPKAKGDFLFAKCVIMVNTGTIDKNGTPVFTGDRVSVGEARGIVIFAPALGAFIVDSNGGKELLSVGRVDEVLSNEEELIKRYGGVDAES